MTEIVRENLTPNIITFKELVDRLIKTRPQLFSREDREREWGGYIGYAFVLRWTEERVHEPMIAANFDPVLIGGRGPQVIRTQAFGVNNSGIYRVYEDIRSIKPLNPVPSEMD